MASISTGEALFLVMICGAADTTDFVITTVLFDLAGGGELVKWGINGATWATVGLWLKMKGVRQTTYAAGSLGEFVPLANALPLRTVGILLTIRQANKEATT